MTRKNRNIWVYDQGHGIRAQFVNVCEKTEIVLGIKIEWSE